ncbi:MAG: hypothetical protein KVP17_003579 [Porospora cf. gigantea B]|uniref:uncharacterized protein n=1 Tax=Porospora cf. gigantea B TaxID=2853592 RepID=UPI003571A914|nr:MAG: hypothetical protein KVP17_003579 [Porospora cf. gigantea B]
MKTSVYDYNKHLLTQSKTSDERTDEGRPIATYSKSASEKAVAGALDVRCGKNSSSMKRGRSARPSAAI